MHLPVRIPVHREHPKSPDAGVNPQPADIMASINFTGGEKRRRARS